MGSQTSILASGESLFFKLRAIRNIMLKLFYAAVGTLVVVVLATHVCQKPLKIN